MINKSVFCWVTLISYAFRIGDLYTIQRLRFGDCEVSANNIQLVSCLCCRLQLKKTEVIPEGERFQGSDRLYRNARDAVATRRREQLRIRK